MAQALGASGEDGGNGGAIGGAAMYSDVAVGTQRRDEIAEAPMVEVPVAAVNPTDEEPATQPDSMAVPSGVVPGPAAVLTGFPHSPEGAVGQLAAIETTVLQSMSLATAGAVYRAWALPGGSGPEAWPLTTSVRAFLGGADMGEAKDEAATVSIEPAGAMVKGTDGPDWATGLCPGHCHRLARAGGPDRLRPLRADAVGRGPMDDRPRCPAGHRPVGLARQPGGRRGRLVDLGHGHERQHERQRRRQRGG